MIIGGPVITGLLIILIRKPKNEKEVAYITYLIYFILTSCSLAFPELYVNLESTSENQPFLNIIKLMFFGSGSMNERMSNESIYIKLPSFLYIQFIGAYIWGFLASAVFELFEKFRKTEKNLQHNVEL